ncbi:MULTISPECIES: S8 family peptidase [Streptomyces]|uniref:S8 family serine peptidase n=1 Tax=Streptomyces sudanensis TaxID=436397 RepID=A0ABY4TJ27_9ACTN|nr:MULTISPECIES: S8 family serine peptidase [Streptomyces]MCP9960067.1 S8 family serine peptidase [Streptomyces sudanensis]MCP9989080.1 S8 family serine peptidase [Streptomyces sudanensis]MCP9999536.1 S8 family serine peptidase [Streptomyces sudanensis]URN18919.1 S8 family serine peptidase [Streptomyces sudanensis]
MAASATLLGVTATSAVAFAAQATPSPKPAAPASQAMNPATTIPSAPVEKVIVTYKARTAEATSNTAAKEDTAEKAAKTGEKLSFERRLAGGSALVDLGTATTKQDVADVMAAFRADPAVAAVDADIRAYPMAVTPNDTEYAKQWDLFEPTGGMNVPGAWDKATGTGVTVAVIDTGYAAHTDLAANTVAGYDFISSSTDARDGGGRDSNPKDEGDWNATDGECGTGSRASDSSWHGTHVAGTIGAVTHNAKGIAGIAYGAKVQHVRVLGKCGGSSADIADAITWASGGSVPGVPVNATPAKVINLSLGGASSTCPTVYQNAINGAVSRGSTVVVAAGNSNTNASGFTPANCNNIINVASTSREGNRSYYSNYGTIIDVSAPGGETRRATDTPGTVTTPQNGILSTLNSGATTQSLENYEPYQGTSMAAPHIAGLAALLKSAKSTLTPAEIESAIKANARPLPGTCTGGCGTGIADATKTVNAVLGGTTPGGSTFTNANNVTIADNATVTSSVAVTGVTGYAPATLKVNVDIKHTWRGDLVVDLVAPDGTAYRLKNSDSSDSADNILATYTVNASSELANGTWKLQVRDIATGDTGYIDSWGLTF